MAKRKRRRRGGQRKQAPQQSRNWSLMGIGGAIALVALAMVVGIARAV